MSHPKDRLTLIFSGKILKDIDTISSYGVKDGMVIHVRFFVFALQESFLLPMKSRALDGFTCRLVVAFAGRCIISSFRTNWRKYF